MNSKLVPERVYKENRANWNVNYLPENPRNWVLPAWNEPAPINWNQLQPNMKNGRKVSGKQHYFSLARYIAGQSASLSSRYRTFRDLLKRILTPSSLIILGCMLLCCLIWKNELLHKHFTCLDLIEYFFWRDHIVHTYIYTYISIFDRHILSFELIPPESFLPKIEFFPLKQIYIL